MVKPFQYDVQLDDMGKAVIKCSQQSDNTVRMIIDCKNLKSANKILNFVKKKIKTELV